MDCKQSHECPWICATLGNHIAEDMGEAQAGEQLAGLWRAKVVVRVRLY